MADVWSTVADLDLAVRERLAGVLETRGANPQQRAMRRAFLADIAFPDDARVLEVGCGTGVLTRALARWPGVGTVVGGGSGAGPAVASPRAALSLPAGGSALDGYHWRSHAHLTAEDLEALRAFDTPTISATPGDRGA